MLRNILILLFSGISICCFSFEAPNPAQPGVVYFGRENFLIEGTVFPDSVKESPYDRLPFSWKEKVRKPVWDLSKSSAGLSVRFLTNSSAIHVKWSVLTNMTMNHMAETGIKGIDLYFSNHGNWQFVNTARPTGKDNEALLVSRMNGQMREYKMFLPLYDGLTNLEIGLDSGSVIMKPAKTAGKPIVFYGTSITQGGCASRPGMAHTNIISRKLHTDCINFGFSGNGRMEEPIVELIAGIDARFYVIECLPNMSIDEVVKNVIPLVRIIRSKQPVTQIIFVENPVYENASLDDTVRMDTDKKNAALMDQYRKLTGQGYKDIYSIGNEGTREDDHEGTVDGVHLTDLGFMRYADFLIGKFKEFGLVENELNR